MYMLRGGCGIVCTGNSRTFLDCVTTRQIDFPPFCLQQLGFGQYLGSGHDGGSDYDGIKEKRCWLEEKPLFPTVQIRSLRNPPSSLLFYTQDTLWALHLATGRSCLSMYDRCIGSSASSSNGRSPLWNQRTIFLLSCGFQFKYEEGGDLLEFRRDLI